MNIVVLLLVLGFGVSLIQLIWTITDPRPEKNYLLYFKRKGFLKTYTAQILLIIPQVISGIFFPWSMGALDLFIVVIGVLIFYVGIFLAIWAKLIMRKSWGVPAEHDIKRQSELITTGPFAFSRNPIYVGLLLLSFGFSLALRSYFLFFSIFLFLYFEKVIKKEEKLLTDYFGQAYTHYIKNVPRYISVKKLFTH